MLRGRLIISACVAAILAVVAYITFELARGGSSARFEPELALAAAVAITVGSSVLGLNAVVGAPRLAATSAVAAFLVSFGAIAIFSFGLPLLAAGLVVSAIAWARARRHERGRSAVRGGLLLGLGLAAVTLSLLQPAIVTCGDYGARVSGSSIGGSIRVDRDGHTTGDFWRGQEHVVFSCDNGVLTEYRRE